jgi:hypothetical protein
MTNSFSMRRVIVVTSRLNPPINNMQWRATLGGAERSGPFGLGATEPEAVRDLYEEITFREAKVEEQHEAGE